jgi:hypothetical protein
MIFVTRDRNSESSLCLTISTRMCRHRAKHRHIAEMADVVYFQVLRENVIPSGRAELYMKYARFSHLYSGIVIIHAVT